MRNSLTDVVMFTAGAPPISAHEGDLHIWLVRPSQWPAAHALLPHFRGVEPPAGIGPRCEPRHPTDIVLGRVLLNVLRQEYDDGRIGAPLHGAVAAADGLLALAIGRVGRVRLRLAVAGAHDADEGWDIPGLPRGYRGSVRTACRPDRLLVATLHADRPAMSVHYCGGVSAVSAHARTEGPRRIQ